MSYSACTQNLLKLANKLLVLTNDQEAETFHLNLKNELLTVTSESSQLLQTLNAIEDYLFRIEAARRAKLYRTNLSSKSFYTHYYLPLKKTTEKLFNSVKQNQQIRDNLATIEVQNAIREVEQRSEEGNVFEVCSVDSP